MLLTAQSDESTLSTTVDQAFLARGTSLIKEDRLNDNPLPDLDVINTFTNLDDGPAKLVADDHRGLLSGVRMWTGRDQVRPLEIFM